jgi:hypothetical protein
MQLVKVICKTERKNYEKAKKRMLTIILPLCMLALLAGCDSGKNEKNISINKLVKNQMLTDDSEYSKEKFIDEYEPQLKKYFGDDALVDDFLELGEFYPARIVSYNKVEIDKKTFYVSMILPTIVFTDGLTNAIFGADDFIKWQYPKSNEVTVTCNKGEYEIGGGFYYFRNQNYYDSESDIVMIKAGDKGELHVAFDIYNKDNQQEKVKIQQVFYFDVPVTDIKYKMQ